MKPLLVGEMQCENKPFRGLEGSLGRLQCPGLQRLLDSFPRRREKLKVFRNRAVGEHRRRQEGRDVGGFAGSGGVNTGVRGAIGPSSLFDYLLQIRTPGGVRNRQRGKKTRY